MVSSKQPVATAPPNSPHDQDEEVFQLLQAGAPDAAARLIEVFGDRVYGLSVRIIGSEEDAKEAVQETFLTIWRKWPTFQEKSRFSSWIYRIAANQAFMKLRKRRKHKSDVSLDELGDAGVTDPLSPAEGRAEQEHPLTVPPDQELEQRELSRLIEDAVEELLPIYRTAYILKDVNGLSLKEVATIMNVSEPAAKSRVHRARLELRRRLGPYLGL